jgi:flagellar basal body-associated protein FliL
MRDLLADMMETLLWIILAVVVVMLLFGMLWLVLHVGSYSTRVS